MALHEAILKGDFVVTRRLVERGADVNAHDGDSRTPLMLCCLHCDEGWALGVARMLLAHGGHVGLRDCHGRTALVYAVLYQRPDLVRIFLHALDSDPTAPDHVGGTPLGYAARNGHRTIEKLLLQTVRRYRWSGETGNGGTKPRNRGTKGGAAPAQPIGNQTLRSDHSGWTNTLPYKALSEKVWTNRVTFQKKPRPKHLPAARAAGQTVSGETGVKSGDKAEKKGTSGDKSSSLDWRLDMRCLLDILQEQNSTSYRVCAQPHPKPPRARHRPLRPVATSGMQGALYTRRQNSRKLSLSALDDTVLGEKLVRRRCTVAVIPLIRPVGGRTPSLSGLNSLRLQGDSNVMHSTKSSGKVTLPKITALKK